MDNLIEYVFYVRNFLIENVNNMSIYKSVDEDYNKNVNAYVHYIIENLNIVNMLNVKKEQIIRIADDISKWFYGFKTYNIFMRPKKIKNILNDTRI